MKRTLQLRRAAPPAPQAAFTLPDLLAVLAVCGLLGLMLVPAWAGSLTRSQSVRCLDNLRQVMGAMLMYTHDNHDLFPPNPDDGYSVAWCPSPVSGPPPYASATGAGTFNPDTVGGPQQCLILSYLHSNSNLLRCTADPRVGLYSGSNPALAGKLVPATRTISMSCAVGTTDSQYATGFYPGHSGVPDQPVPAPSLNGGLHGNRHNSPYRTYGKTSDMVLPAPASLLVVTEEDPFSINDDCFAASVGSPKWLDWPSSLHNSACVVSFADGHAELHKWLNRATRLSQPATTVALPATDPDWNWVAQRISVLY